MFPAIEYLFKISDLSILSAAFLKTAGSFASSLPGALSPLHGPNAFQASSSFSAKTVHLYVWIRRLSLFNSFDLALEGSITFSYASFGSFTLIISPSVYSDAN